MTGLFRQSTLGRLGGYEGVNDADRLGCDPAMRWIVGGRAVTKLAASASQMGRFETEFLATDDNIAALADLSGAWIDRVHDRKPPTDVVLDMDSSVSPTYGDQEGWPGGRFGCLLSPAVPVQPHGRPGAVFSAARQCPQCRRLA